MGKIYLDNLLLYYWLNFFGSIILLYAIILLFLVFNTVDIPEVNYFCSCKPLLLIILFFLLAFSLKIGVPGLHSLKIEIFRIPLSDKAV